MTLMEKRIQNLMNRCQAGDGCMVTLCYADGSQKTMPAFRAAMEAITCSDATSAECEDESTSSLLNAIIAATADDFSDLEEI